MTYEINEDEMTDSIRTPRTKVVESCRLKLIFGWYNQDILNQEAKAAEKPDQMTARPETRN